MKYTKIKKIVLCVSSLQISSILPLRNYFVWNDIFAIVYIIRRSCFSFQDHCNRNMIDRWMDCLFHLFQKLHVDAMHSASFVHSMMLELIYYCYQQMMISIMNYMDLMLNHYYNLDYLHFAILNVLHRIPKAMSLNKDEMFFVFLSIFVSTIMTITVS